MNFLITGHSEFALGMHSALTMITGSIEDVMIIPFLVNEKADEYRQKIESSIQMNEQVVCFTDLVGGTPFKTCVELSMKKDQAFVVSGTNIGMLLEGLIMRNSGIEPFEFAKSVVQVGKSNIVLLKKINKAEELSEEGI
ncbi:PTS sugar transporter subunit IIA [Enterococcus sp. DIV1420a]|uniref:PTS sugar transporter subunit IIA n=1 Tax=Enterococcus sp. DIV1420a TaxID=2774672 RepID=UPI003F204D93